MCRSTLLSITLRSVLSSKKSEPEETPETRAASDRTKSGPTPTRKAAQARNDHSLIVADRKAAKKAARERARAMRAERDRLEQEALVTGDERYMPLRDKGTVKRFTRDWIDARRGVVLLVNFRSCSACTLHRYADHVRTVLDCHR